MCSFIARLSDSGSKKEMERLRGIIFSCCLDLSFSFLFFTLRYFTVCVCVFFALFGFGFPGVVFSAFFFFFFAFFCFFVELRGNVENRTYGTHRNLYIFLFLLVDTGSYLPRSPVIAV